MTCLYCFCCSEKRDRSDIDPITDQCLFCKCVVEECEWDSTDNVWVPIPPGETIL